MGFDLTEYAAGRADALVLLHSAEQSGDHTSLFKMTETYRAGAEGQTKTTSLLRALASCLEDILLLQAGAVERIRNVDKKAELQRMAESFSFEWIESAVRAMDAVQSGMRRNLLRSLSLDALAVELESSRR
jgi:DNA polymerase-3 subunit delta'